MKRKIVTGILILSMAATLLSGCSKKTVNEDSSTLKAGTLSLLNSSEEDYGNFQDRSLNMIIGIENGVDPDQAAGNAADAEGKKTQFVYYDDLTSMIMGLDAGEIEAVQVYSCVGKYLSSSNTSLKVKDLYEEATKEETKNAIDAVFTDGFSFMLTEDKKELRDELDGAIAEMKKDGTLDRLVKEQIEDVIAGNEPAKVSMETKQGAETIKIAVTGDLPPLDYIAPDGTPAGFNTAVLAEIGKRIGKNIELVNIAGGARAVALASGNVDAVFWTRSSLEGLPPEEAPEGSADGEDPQGLMSQGADLPELPPESDDGMSKALEEYKKRDMPDGTIVTIPYFTDHFVLLTKK